MEINKIKKVLIALDYDPTAEKVLKTGFSLAKAMGAEVILLHVTSDPAYYCSSEYPAIMGFNGYMDMGSPESVSVEELKKASHNFLDQSKNHLGDKSIQILVKEGNFADAILTTAKELNVEFIVMGSHSRRWLEEILLGSVTEKVLHQTTIPLFIIPTKKINNLKTSTVE